LNRPRHLRRIAKLEGLEIDDAELDRLVSRASSVREAMHLLDALLAVAES